MLLNMPIQKLKFKKRMPTMRRKEAHTSFLLVYTSFKMHCCHLTQFSICNSGWSSSFLADYFFSMMSSMICQMGIEHLGLWVCGKADKGVKKYLKVVTDQEYLDLDAVSVLLVYSWLIVWKGGYLFPSSGEIHS